MKALIFGVTGQDGHYLSELLTRSGVQVTGVSRHGGDVLMDVSDRTGVEMLIREIVPDFVFHLAAESSVAHEYLWQNHAAISTGALAILDAVDRHHRDCRVLLAGSALQFINRSEPISEEIELDHSSPYVVSRNQSVYAARYFRRRGLKVFFAYLFNHDSPLRTSRHLNMKICEAAVAASRGSGDKFLIGDSEAEKEFNYAGDVADALLRLIQQDRIFECVIGSGTAYPVKRWLELCYSHVGLNWEDHVSTDSSYRSPYRKLVSDPEKLRSLGWKPAIGIEELAAMMMEEALRKGS